MKDSSSVIYYILHPCYWFLKKVQLFLAVGVYSGILIIYLQCTSNESRTRTANVVFYIICLLYVLCAAAVVSDLIALILEVDVGYKFICKNIILIISRVGEYQYTSDGLTAN